MRQVTSIKDRIEHYELALYAISNTNTKSGVCFFLMWWPKRMVNISYNELEAHYPEFFSQRPPTVTIGEYWWKIGAEGIEERRNALNVAIKLAKAKL